MLTPQLTYYRVRDQSVLNRTFLYFALQATAFQDELKRIAGAGSTRAYIGILRQLDLSISFPSLERQRELTHHLQMVAAESARLQAMYNARAEEIANLRRSILSHAFSGQLTATKGLAA
jgi:type I restriction enzyme, S subunit